MLYNLSLYCSVQYITVLTWNMALHSALCSTTQSILFCSRDCTILYTILYTILGTTVHYTVLHYSALLYTILYTILGTTVHYTVLHYLALLYTELLAAFHQQSLELGLVAVHTSCQNCPQQQSVLLGISARM